MSLKLRINDLTSHGGWFFNLRAALDRQLSMTLDVSRGDESGTFSVHGDSIFAASDARICGVSLRDGAYVIEQPDSLIETVQKSARSPQTAPDEEPPEIAQQPRLMVA